LIEAVVSQGLLVAGILLTAFTGPIAALWFMVWRRRRALAARRSPLTQDLLREPGHALREQMEGLRLDVLAWLMVASVLPLALLAIHLAQSYFLRASESIVRFVFVGGLALASVGFGMWRAIGVSRRTDALRLGIDAELAAGQELDQLMRQGAAVYHDFPAEKFNVDHIVIAPQGVFAVETKGYSKPNRGRGEEDARVEFDGRTLKFPTRTTAKPLEQAARQAQWLSKWLTSATGEPVGVTPVLALPGWFVDRKGRGAVRVFSGRELAGLLKARGSQSLSSDQMQRVVHQVEQRCRNVKPNYRLPDEDD
jgi:hypothetical protein